MPLSLSVTQQTQTPLAVDYSDVVGEDVSLRGGDFTETPGGDWAAITSQQAALQSVERESGAMPGECPRRPDWGFGIAQDLNRGAGPDVRDRAVSRTRARLAVNPRIQRVNDVTCVQRIDIPNAVQLNISADIAGQAVALGVTVTPPGVNRPDMTRVIQNQQG